MLQTINFCNSTISWLTQQEQSYGLFQVEARLSVSIVACNFLEVYYLLSGVMAGNMYTSGAVIKSPSYHFQAILSEQHFKIFRIHTGNTVDKDTHGKLEDVFAKVDFMIDTQPYDRLNEVKSIKNAIQNRCKLNVAMQLKHLPQAQVLVEFPVKHININQRETMWQVETGPVIIPDAGFAHHPSIENLVLAYTNFNKNKEAEFAILETQKNRSIRAFSAIQAYPVDIDFQKLHS